MTLPPDPNHPCAGHACDNCATCRSGTCCSAGGQPSTNARLSSPADLNARTADVAADASQHLHLTAANLIGIEAFARAAADVLVERMALQTNRCKPFAELSPGAPLAPPSVAWRSRDETFPKRRKAHE